MAHYSIQYSCGHAADKQLYGKQSERDNYIAWATRAGACAACCKSDQAKMCDEIEAEYTLPALTGSPKQITWARTIRAEKIGAVATFVAAKRPATMTEAQTVEFETQHAATMQTLYAKTAARWWIDNRDNSGQQIALAAFKEARR